VKKWYLVLVRGCEDTTSIKIEFTSTEALVAEHIAREITKASQDSSQPIMDVVLYDSASNWDKEDFE